MEIAKKKCMGKMDSIAEGVNEIHVKIARIEEHLKGINGGIQRHESQIGILYEKQEKTSLRMAKYIGAGGFGGAIVTVFTYLISLMKGG